MTGETALLSVTMLLLLQYRQEPTEFLDTIFISSMSGQWFCLLRRASINFYGRYGGVRIIELFEKFLGLMKIFITTTVALVTTSMISEIGLKRLKSFGGLKALHRHTWDGV